MKSKLTMMVAAAMACAAVQLAAMPTEEEARKAEPVVKKLLAQERAALNSGKKTRSEVAAAAMKLADEADTDAAKLLLMKGACDFYVHAGEFDKAIETLQTIMTKIPDIPYATIVSILEYSLRGVSRNSAKDLWAFLDETKSRLRNTDTTHGKKAQSETNIQKFSRLFPGWEVCKEAQGRLGFELAYRGQFNVAVLHPVSQDIPAVVSRTLKLSGKNPCLFLKVSSCDYDGECDWVLSVRVNGKEVLPKRLINKTPNSELWEDITVPLFAWRGQEVKVEVVVTANGWYYEFASFKRLEIAEGSGRENLIPEAQETVDGYTWSYRVQNGEATIISEKEGKMSCAVSPNPVGSIVIPDILGGAKVTSIGRDALAGCQELESVTIPQGVKRIERQAFLGCKKLKSVEIPSSVIGIDWCAFYICNALATVDIPSDSNLKSLENGAFAGCFALKSIAIPDGVTRIARHAFLGCFNLKSLTIPATASSIGGEAFRYCVNLSSVTMLGEKPDTSVPPGDRPHTSDNIFLDCGKLKEIHVPASAKSWAEKKDWHGIPLVFDGQSETKNGGTPTPSRSLSLLGSRRLAREQREAERKATVDGYTWSYRVRNCEATLVAEKDGKYSCAVSPAPTGDISIPATLGGAKVTSIGREAFKNCSGLTSVTIPEGVRGIEWEAFRYCKNLTSVTVPEGVTHIGYNAFCDCSGIKSLKLPSSLKVIGMGAFGRCAGLTSLEIPEGVTSIEYDAFNGCGGLESVVIPDSVTSIGDRAFIGCEGLTSVTIPEKVVNLGKGVLGGCNALKVVNVDSGNQAFTSIDGVLYTKDRSVLVMWPNPPMSVVIPEGVTNIRGWAFAKSRRLASVTIPGSVTSIGDVAFLECEGLKSMTIPSSVKNIGEHAFERCRELASVTMLGERPEAPNDIFQSCGKLKSIHVPANAKSWAGMKDWFGIPLVFDGESVNERADAPAQEMSVVANKLKSCNFLLNKDFKKNAKYYLCLFSASWCPPCRAEMPRIAKTYAETLKDDQNIELIHFSWDQNDEKALAWAKEHDVKFPVVKPKGGNPLDLHTRGIPHLFIVKADGTLVEEGHPMKLFTDEKLRELKAASLDLDKKRELLGLLRRRLARNRRDGEQQAQDEESKMSEVKLPYEVVDGAVVLGSRFGRLRPRSLRMRKGVDDRKYTTVKFTHGTLAIPDAIDGLPVVGIGYWAFSGCKGLKSVAIPASVTNIVDGAFADCNDITSFSVDASNPSYSSRNGLLCSKDGTVLIAGVNGDVTIPSCVQSIGKWAFKDHNGLMSVTIPESVTNIGEWAFGSCSGLKSVRIPANVESIGGAAFWSCRGLMSVSISAKVASIGKAAFSYCSALKEINVDSGNQTFTSIDGVLYTKDRSVLVACPNALTAVTILKGVTGIGPYAFEGCNNLTTVIMPEGVTRIECAAFKECSRLVSVVIPASVVRIEKEAFLNCRSLPSVTIPDGVACIDEYAFRGCCKLTAITIPSRVKDIKRAAFYGCSGLTSLTIQEGVEVIDWDAFQGCTSLTSMTIPSSVTRIGTCAFCKCSQLKSVTILSKMLDVGYGAFKECGELSAVTMRGECPTSQNDIFKGCGKLKAIHVPATAKSWDGMQTWHGIPIVVDGAAGPKTAAIEIEDLDIAVVKERAENGDAAAMCELGSRYLRGVDVSVDDKEAEKWIMKAASNGHERANGLCYAFGYGVAKDAKEAVKWYMKAADKGDRCAMNNIGICYKNGDGVKKDEKEAAKWVRVAADRGLSLAMDNLSYYYDNGIGVDKDYKESLKWIRMAAEKGSAWAMYGLGCSYENGCDVKMDMAEAVKWYRKAAEKGEAGAMFSLGNCYVNGKGVEKDEKEAEKWYRMAADKGDARAIEHFKGADRRRILQRSNVRLQTLRSRRQAREEAEKRERERLEAERKALEAERRKLDAERKAEREEVRRQLQQLREKLWKVREERQRAE